MLVARFLAGNLEAERLVEAQYRIVYSGGRLLLTLNNITDKKAHIVLSINRHVVSS